MKKKPVGRPTKYTPELLKKARNYIHEYEKYDHAFPSAVGLADALKIVSSTIYDWALDPEKKEFSDILARIKDKQELIAWKKGLTGEYNANLIKLLLGKHGYKDGDDQNAPTPQVTFNIHQGWDKP